MIDGPGRRSSSANARARDSGSEVITPPLDKCSITMSASLLIAREGQTQTLQAMIQSIAAEESITNESDESLIDHRHVLRMT